MLRDYFVLLFSKCFLFSFFKTVGPNSIFVCVGFLFSIFQKTKSTFGCKKDEIVTTFNQVV